MRRSWAKTLLARRLGYSRFRQRLFSEDIGELQDEMPLRQLARVQMVILDLYAPEEGVVWQELRLACENNQLSDVTRLLQKQIWGRCRQ